MKLKRTIAVIITIACICSFFNVASETLISGQTQIEGNIIDMPQLIQPPTIEEVPDAVLLAAPPLEEDPPQIESRNYSINISNMSNYSLVALNNMSLNGGHVRGSIWVGGTLHGGVYVDDGSINHITSGNYSYIANNESTVSFQSRTSNQSTTAYYSLTEEAISTTKYYWTNILTNANSEGCTWVYLEPDHNGNVDIYWYDYQCPGTDESQSSIQKIYWTDATTVNMGGLAGHLIAPYATVNITWCNHCGTIVAKNIVSTGEGHINYWTPPTPPITTESPSPSPSESPTPTPEPIDLKVTKTLVGSVWHIRCDYMDGETFKAGGGFGVVIGLRILLVIRQKKDTAVINAAMPITG